MEALELPDLHSISDSEAEALCARLRTSLIETVSQTGGHLASNLGAVELTVALHRVFDTGSDRLVFDVGHQCYCHKILTGRGGAMDTLRTFGGLAGFPKPQESVHDAFIAGHASNSVSVALGMARARSILGEDYSVLALLGDGALSGGLAYEGLSNAGESGEPLIVILNDNGMSITKSVGGVAQHLAHQRLKPQYLSLKKGYRKVMSVLPGGGHIYRFTHKLKKAVKDALLPGSIFEDMGFTYLGPVDGHDVRLLTRLLRYARELKGPILLHVRTVKGKGYTPAEQNPDAYHGVTPFNISDGTPVRTSKPGFSSAFGAALCELAQEDRRICAITAAMQSGTGLDQFSRQFPDRFFDVGIAEEHAVSMAAGMAKQGMIPVFAVYSTFLQRSYDMLLHDVAIQGLHVVFAVDRAGLVGEDGETHHGVFDPAFLDTVPGMTVLCPASFQELRSMLRRAVYEVPGPVAVRYPRGGETEWQEDRSAGQAVLLREGGDITLVGYGTMIQTILETAELLSQHGIAAEVVKLNTITPINIDCIEGSVQKTGRLLVAEDSVAMNCVGRRVITCLAEKGTCPRAFALQNVGNGFVTHGSVAQLRKLCGLDARSLCIKAEEVCRRG
ncbi:MAG: 1-deoxy-D-xylulose-5-phosphate synthase [Oscillospiraceae bacterium]